MPGQSGQRKSREGGAGPRSRGSKCSATRVIDPSARSTRPRTRRAGLDRATGRHRTQAPREQTTLTMPGLVLEVEEHGPPGALGLLTVGDDAADGDPVAGRHRGQGDGGEHPATVQRLAGQLHGRGARGHAERPQVVGHRLPRGGRGQRWWVGSGDHPGEPVRGGLGRGPGRPHQRSSIVGLLLVDVRDRAGRPQPVERRRPWPVPRAVSGSPRPGARGPRGPTTGAPRRSARPSPPRRRGWR